MVKNNYIKLIQSDLFRYTGSTSLGCFFKLYLTNVYFRFQVYLRLSNVNLFILSFIFKLLKARVGKKINVQLSRKVPIGFGLYIPHGNVVVNSQSRIGHNCSLLQFSSIGAVHKKPAACIEDNVYIGPNVNIIGNINIGCCSVIGAGSVVVKDVAINSVVGGVPAQILKKVDDISLYCENLFPMENFMQEAFL